MQGIHQYFFPTEIISNFGQFRALNSNGSLANWLIKSMACPSCQKAIIFLENAELETATITSSLVHPKSAGRPSAPPEVPPEIAEDFNEACVVLADSPKASAALSRRCLQGLLRGHGFDQHDLAKAIDAILATKQLPSWLASSLDAVRNIGNFAAHPMKDTNSGAILPVEPHEAEWNVDVLDGLFDFFYVSPAREQAKIAALNAKLALAGKPPIK